MDAPQCKKELESLQGIMNYIKYSSSQLTQVAEPLKELLRNDMLWCWESKHQEHLKLSMLHLVLFKGL